MKETTGTKKRAAKTEANSSGGLTADQVAAYLKQHPEFFIDRDQLLADMTLPHESGKAISLLERQVTILRDRSIEARHTLNTLMENARTNDQLLSVTRNLILSLLAEQDRDAFASLTEANLATQPGIDVCRVIYFDNDGEVSQELQHLLPVLFERKGTHCQAVNRDLAALLFPNHQDAVRSVALCPIGDPLVGILAVGNHGHDYFNEDLETTFLDFIGEVLSSLIKPGA